MLLPITGIISALHGQDRTSLIEVSPSSRRHVTFPEKLVGCFLLLLVKIHPPPQVLREKTQASAVSEVSGPCKTVMDLFQTFTHDGSVLTGTGAPQSLLLSDTLVFSEKLSACASVPIRGISSKYTPVPPYTVYISIHQ